MSSTLLRARKNYSRIIQIFELNAIWFVILMISVQDDPFLIPQLDKEPRLVSDSLGNMFALSL